MGAPSEGIEEFILEDLRSRRLFLLFCLYNHCLESTSIFS